MSRPLILGLCGSLRPQSYTCDAVARALASAEGAGATTALLSASELVLPLCDSREAAHYPPAVRALYRRVRDAQGLIVGTPEYCGTYSAVIKNAMEWLGPTAVGRKIVGVLAVAEGPSAHGSLSNLQALCLNLGAWVVPMTASVPLAQHAFAKPDSPLTQAAFAQLAALGQSVVEACERLGVTRRSGEEA